MNVVKGSDLVKLFVAMGRLDEFVKFGIIEQDTREAINSKVEDSDVLRAMLHRWLDVLHPAVDAVARPVGDVSE